MLDPRFISSFFTNVSLELTISFVCPILLATKSSFRSYEVARVASHVYCIIQETIAIVIPTFLFLSFNTLKAFFVCSSSFVRSLSGWACGPFML